MARAATERLRAALAPLTLRGRAFVAAGVTALGCAVAFGQDPLARAGGLVLALPLLALLAQARRDDVEVTRTLAPGVVAAGEHARVTVAVAAAGRRTGARLQCEEQLPYPLGARPRFVLQGLGAGWRRELEYRVRPEVRGRYEVGPLMLHSGDPFGLVERRTAVGGTDVLVVTPRVIALPPVALGGGWQGAGEHRPQAFAAGSSEDVSVREYRRGDDLRRVHWRTSARTGELMVRREEQPWEAHATVWIDDRVGAHRGEGHGSSLEAAVVVAASVTAHLHQHGYAVHLVGASGVLARGGPAALRRLAVLEAAPTATVDTSWSAERRGGVVVAVLGALAPADGAVLRRLRHDAGSALAVVLDVGQWSAARTGSGGDAVAAPLHDLGWRACGLGQRDRLDVAWRDLGAATTRRPRAAGRGAG